MPFVDNPETPTSTTDTSVVDNELVTFDLPSFAVYKISGYTRDSNNNILPNCTVTLYFASNDSIVATTVSDSNGYFEFTNLSSEGPYYLRAYKSGTPNLIGTTSRNIYGEQVS